MQAYVVLKKRKEMGIFLPNFEAYTDKPELLDEKWKLLTLEDGECVDVAKFSISPDLDYVQVMQYRVTNKNERMTEELLESYTLPRHGR